MKFNFLLIATIGTLSVGSLLGQETITPSQVTVPANTESQKDGSNSDSDIALGQPIQWDSPKYPKHAFENRMQGTVVLRLNVSKDGKVANVAAIDGDPELADAAVRAVRKWRYVPYFRDRGVLKYKRPSPSVSK